MKIIANNIAYIQKNDTAYLNQTDLTIPTSIFIKIFGNGIVIIDDSNRYEFIEFEAPEERKNNMSMISQCELLDFKMYSLRDVLWFKQEHIKMELPEDVDFPAGFEQEKGIRKLIKIRFNKKKK